ncbi:hypothetical protein Kpol_1045p59 [Vanderwaltozyma polyspora DSM 70294]|uniref:Thiamine-binding protein domain-containing protein n=1 Tax=Vanderwaltozyma polyspora (strain ATCC 22028 / DSM 70294 / BCRC 21397 / CBS 2163 / NBRC 10782 / NRRL Y-8283 / UCD 57-17) TaxID=436907 RepID=A7TI65_VANPO|nr:uncharacterized protein Kpol_1045p59 [Vanderwaltozyma polyspora DSM 70294]EDO18072.1 hypothetical protein Kpol_1045p59 [Vanderwaltozyma polyspora DSM 70294]
MYCVADLCVVPVGTNSVSGSDFVAILQKKIHSSGLKSTLHSAGTTIEGNWDDVVTLVGELHEFGHENGFVRIHSHLRLSTRTDKEPHIGDKD